MPSIYYAECLKQAHCSESRYAECHYGECRYGECRGASGSFWWPQSLIILVTVFANVRLGWKCMADTFAYDSTEWSTSVKSLYSLSFWGLCDKTFYGCNLWIFVISYSVCPWHAFPAFNVCGWGQGPTLEWSTWKVLHLCRLQPYPKTLD
jgi:hypothetical protein